MAIYHLHVKVIGRKSGSSAVAVGCLPLGSRLRDERLDRSTIFLQAQHRPSEVMRRKCAGGVEAARNGSGTMSRHSKSARTPSLPARSNSHPREMSEAQGIELARDFAPGRIRGLGL